MMQLAHRRRELQRFASRGHLGIPTRIQIQARGDMES
ncbi:hypothetical protein E2C01_072337 [Portunus trituberculatus]|uniref:Uncharacterized protein n=1 Tax=Portunus trituberculatus TaxID=210409 RepID=A0A5B7IAH1_PORTR|nr:hypothetical protein [Portunus trituberculatus]